MPAAHAKAYGGNRAGWHDAHSVGQITLMPTVLDGDVLEAAKIFVLVAAWSAVPQHMRRKAQGHSKVVNGFAEFALDV